MGEDISIMIATMATDPRQRGLPRTKGESLDDGTQQVSNVTRVSATGRL